jgi:hypothetical protein
MLFGLKSHGVAEHRGSITPTANQYDALPFSK